MSSYTAPTDMGPVTDGDGDTWTWRPEAAGYVMERLDSHGRDGKARIGISSATIREQFGAPVDDDTVATEAGALNDAPETTEGASTDA